VGKAIVNSPLFKCAVAGNDPNVGRLVAAIGKCIGCQPGVTQPMDMSRVTIHMGGLLIFEKGEFRLGPDTEKKLIKHLRDAQLWGGWRSSSLYVLCRLFVRRRIFPAHCGRRKARQI
jgi:glutamate N-acetyltransferase/amino-acid N-acetyltransferase